MKKRLIPVFCWLIAACNPSRNIPKSYRAHECTIQISKDTAQVLNQWNELQLQDSNDDLRVLQYNIEKERMDTFPHSKYLACSLYPQQLPSCTSVDSLIEQHKEALQTHTRVPLGLSYTGQLVIDLLTEKPIWVLKTMQWKNSTYYVSYNKSKPYTGHEDNNTVEEEVRDLTLTTLDVIDDSYLLRTKIESGYIPANAVVIPDDPQDPCAVHEAQIATQRATYEYYEQEKERIIEQIQNANEALQKYPQVFVKEKWCPEAMTDQFTGKSDFFSNEAEKSIAKTQATSYTQVEFQDPCAPDTTIDCITLQKAWSTIAISSNCESTEFTYQIFTTAGSMKCQGTAYTNIDLTTCNLWTSPTIYSIIVYNKQWSKSAMQISYP